MSKYRFTAESSISGKQSIEIQCKLCKIYLKVVPQAIPVGQPMGSQPMYQQYGSFAGAQRSQSATQVAAPAGQNVMIPQGATVPNYSMSMIRPGVQV